MISGANSSTYVATTAGDYTVEIDSVGCVAMSPPVTVTVNTIPAQPGPITGADTTCNGGVQTYFTGAVPGATSYAWVGISTQGMFVNVDTTILPTITGNVSPSQSMPITNIYVRALNECGASQPATRQVIDVASPQIGGSWTIGNVDVADMNARICPGNNYTLFPVMHAAPGIVHTDPYTFQWYLNNTAIAGATGWEYVVNRGGNYSVKISTHYCNETFTVPKKVYQDVPNSITVSPSGPLSYCVGNATPLTVSFDMTGVSDPISWHWVRNGGYATGIVNSYSILPDTSSYYGVLSKWGYSTNCIIYSNVVQVTIPQPLEVTQTDDTLFASPGYDTYQWYESGTLLPGETNQKLVLTVDGFYSVEGVFSNGCVESSISFDSDFMPPPPPEPPTPPGTTTQEPGEQMTVSPNPVTGSFVLSAKIAPGDTKATIIITDATGRMMFEKEVDVVDGIVEEKIELGDASSQVGIIKLRSASTLKTTRFFKK